MKQKLIWIGKKIIIELVVGLGVQYDDRFAIIYIIWE